MSLVNIVKQLRRLPVLNGNVAAGAIEELQNYQFASLPAAYVVPLEDVAGENDSMTATFQVVTQRIGIVVIFSNTDGVVSGNDRRGQATAQQFDIVKFSVFHAILNWNPWSIPENQDIPDSNTNAELTDLADPIIGHAIRGFRYEGCAPVAYGLDRTAYEYRFAIDYTISDDDGWKLEGVPLEEMLIEYVDQETDKVLATTDIDGLQDVTIQLRGVSTYASVGSL